VAAQGTDVPGTDPIDGEQLLIARGRKPVRAAHVPQQQLARLGPDPGDALQRRGKSATFARLLPHAIGKAVGLVPRPREPEQLGSVGLEPERVLLPGQVHAIDQLVPDGVLLLLREAHDVETGQAQVAGLGKRLANIPIKIAYASPLSRAKNTAEAILAGRTTPLWLEAGLLEISHGEWEGKLASDVETRAWAVLEKICAGLGPDDTALVAAHDAVNRVLLCRVLGLPLERIWSFRQAPSSLNVLSGPLISELQVVRLNDSEHVAPLLREALHKAL